MFSPDNRDDNCGFTSTTMGSPLPVAEQATEEASEEVPEKQDPRPSLSKVSSDKCLGFGEFINSLNLPPGVTTLVDDQDQSPELRETIRKIRFLVAEMYSGQKDLLKIRQEREALYCVARPPPPTDPLLGYPFVMKVFLAAKNRGVPAINWSEDGLKVVVNYEEMQEHLTTGRSVFPCRSMAQFIDELQSQGFTRIYKEEVESGDFFEPILLQFEHPNIARGDLVALEKLLEERRLLDKSSDKNLEENDEAEDDEDEEQDEEAGKAEKAVKSGKAARLPQFRVPLHLPAPGHLSRMQLRGDRCCFPLTSTRSALQVARCLFRTLLDHLATVNILQASSHLLKKSRPWDYPPFISSSVKFVRPHDSTILVNVEKPPDYAGYYGPVDADKVTKFFSDYLPRYGNKLTGYKDIVLETSHKPSNFQQNLPIGLAYSDGEDIEHDDVPPPASPADLDSDLDCKPSTSAAAAAAGRSKKATESVDDQDLEEAMQELCGGSTVLKENVSGSRGKAKAQQPKTPKATPRKRPTKCLESSSSENEPPVSQKGKRAKKDSRKSKNIPLETIENRDPLSEEVIPVSRGKAKAPQSKTPKAKGRKRLTSSSEEEAVASPKGKRLKKEGVQASRKRRNIPLEKLVGEDEEETLAKKSPKLKIKQEQETEEEAEQDEFLSENEVQDTEEPKNAEKEEDFEEEENAEMVEEALESEDAEEREELEDDEDPEEDEEEDEDAEENDEDDDDDDYNVQYHRAAPQEPEKPRRYDLRNSKRQ